MPDFIDLFHSSKPSLSWPQAFVQSRWAANMFHLQTNNRFGNKNAMQHPNFAYSRCQIKGLGAGSSTVTWVSLRESSSPFHSP
jgi:hypothetical protein